MPLSRLVLPLGTGMAYKPLEIANTQITTIEVALSYGDEPGKLLKALNGIWSGKELLIIQITQGVPIERPYQYIMEEGLWYASSSWVDLSFGVPTYFGSMGASTREDDYQWDFSKMYAAVWSTPGTRGVQLEMVITYSAV